MIHSGELLRLLPKVLRARDFHLYLENGKRLTDLWLSGGRAILGHKPSGVLRELKNAGERGLFSPLPHPLERRFIKALGEFFPGRQFRLYLNEDSLLRALAEAGFSGPFRDPAFPEKNGKKGSVSIWRPFTKTVTDTVLVPVLPWLLGPEVLVFEKDMDFPPGGLIPPVLLAPVARALYDLAAALKTRNQNRQLYPKIEKALCGQKPETWRRRGIYLTTESAGEEYEVLFKKFLEGGFLIPPSPAEPLILPESMSDGEESKLAKLLANSSLKG
jgi:hypothetical protein